MDLEVAFYVVCLVILAFFFLVLPVLLSYLQTKVTLRQVEEHIRDIYTPKFVEGNEERGGTRVIMICAPLRLQNK